jgi:hypothetical protein
VYVTGFAGSLQEYPFPTKDALFASAGGGGDAFVSKLVLGGVEETANPDASDGPNTGASTPDAGCGCDISRQRHSGGACVLAVLAWAARGRRTRRRRPAASL